MSCIIKGRSIGCTQASRDHYLRGEENEKITICEVSGFATQNADEALAMLELSTKGTKCNKPVYSAKINPETDKLWTLEEWQQAINRLEKNLGLTGHPRVVVEHSKKGRIHRHVLWSRYHSDGGAAKNMGNDYAIHQKTQKEIEQAFKLRPMMAKGRDFKQSEVEWAKRYGFDIFKIRDQITADFMEAKSGQAFKTALEAKGIVLCRGDKSQFVIILPWGQHKALSSMIIGRPTKAILRRAFGDIDIKKLPTVQEGKAQVKARLPKVMSKPKAAKSTGKSGASAHTYISRGKNGSKAGNRKGTASPKRLGSSSVRYWRLDGQRLTSSRTHLPHQLRPSTGTARVNQSNISLKQSGSIKADISKPTAPAAPNTGKSTTVTPQAAGNNSNQIKNSAPQRGYNPSSYINGGTSNIGTKNIPASATQQSHGKPSQIGTTHYHVGGGSIPSPQPPASQLFRVGKKPSPEEKQKQPINFAPMRPSHGFSCDQQYVDYCAACADYMSWEAYFQKWGGATGPSM